MLPPESSSAIKATFLTLAIGAMGAVFAWMLHAPIFMLIGPAVAVSVSGLAGMRMAIDHRLRDVCFILLGLAVGAGFDVDALAVMIRWPFAFVVMSLTLWSILVTSRWLLGRFFRFDPRAALLAAAPGHLSFVVAMASDLGSDVARISMIQSIRLLCLTLVVPFLALMMGMQVPENIAPQGVPIAALHLVLLTIGGVLVGLVFRRLSLPAPLLMGAMAASALCHMTGWVPGVLPDWLILPAYLVLGSLIGTRFSGITLTDLRQSLAAGLAVTVVAVSLAGVASLPVAWSLGMPVAHVLVAFAPGGLETMIAMGAVMGVIPGFVAACHIARLFALTVLLPTMIAQAGKSS